MAQQDQLILHKHILGGFLFSSDGTLKEHGDFELLASKHPNARAPSEQELLIISAHYKQDALRAQFMEKTRRKTQQQIAKWVSEDQFIIQTINTIEELQKGANMHAKRLKEWYGLFAPEAVRAYPDHETFIRLASEKTPHELLADLGIADDNSMGNPALAHESEAAQMLARTLREIYELIAKQITYLEEVMRKYCPNVEALVGGMIGAKLIADVGTLKRLSTLPSSTVQLLGAEKALFRHLRNKTIRPPKHGFIISHPLITRAPKEHRGKVARALANKISIAAKVDYFHGAFIGDELLRDLEEKFS